MVSGAGSTNWLGVTSALAGAWMSAVAYCSVRKITQMSRLKPVDAMVHVFYFGWISAIVSLIAMVTLQRDMFKIPRDASGWLLLTGIGLLACIAQVMLNRGLQLVEAGPATLVRNVDLLFAFVFSVTVLGDVPATWQLWLMSVGGSLMICCGAALPPLVKWYGERLVERRRCSDQ